MRHSASWGKPEGIQDIIARKVVDWSLFTYGSHISQEFLPDFQEANGGYSPVKGESRKVILLLDGSYFAAVFRSLARQAKSEIVHIRYDQNDEFKELLRKEFSHSYRYLQEHGPRTHVPPEIAEFIDFYRTGIPFVYRIHLLPLEKGPRNLELFPSVF